jgi:SAM-dependent methyltransferase
MSQKLETRELYRLDQLPIFQNRMYRSEAEAKACPKGDMLLVEDQKSGLIYNAKFRPELMNYDDCYQNEQGVSQFFREHLNSVTSIVERCLGRDSIVEVGCGKGFFLEMLLEKGFDVTGFDPTYEGNNPRVRRHNFEIGVGIQAEGLILRHVLEHIQDPYDFLVELKAANGGKGKVYIEVPCFDWILKHSAWFDIFYEHVNYFRLSDFQRMFGSLVESGWLFGEQYLYIVADLETLRRPVIEANDRVDMPERFSNKLSGSCQAAIWGGASKGVIFALLMERAGQAVNLVIDINPAKQGLYLPATGLLVHSPDDALATLPKGSTIYVMNSNYLNEIKQMSKNLFNYIEIDHE